MLIQDAWCRLHVQMILVSSFREAMAGWYQIQLRHLLDPNKFKCQRFRVGHRFPSGSKVPICFVYAMLWPGISGVQIANPLLLCTNYKKFAYVVIYRLLDAIFECLHVGRHFEWWQPTCKLWLPATLPTTLVFSYLDVPINPLMDLITIDGEENFSATSTDCLYDTYNG
jgi:hypothetical protein